MKLFETICSFENLVLAFSKVEGNAGRPGVDNCTIEEFSIDLEDRLLLLRRELLAGNYRPSPLLQIGIPKDGVKIRRLAIPTVRDRVVQTSADMELAPILDCQFEDCSFAYRKGRSVKQAIERIIDLRDKGYVWVVDADIYTFFDEIDHELLLQDFRKYVNDEKVVNLIRMWMDIDVLYRGELRRLTKGIPQGSPVSPMLSNLFLDSFDEEMIRDNLKIVRFADDFVILCKGRPKAEDALELTEKVLEKLRLSLNTEKTRIVNFDHGFKFLGVEFLRSIVFKPEYKDDIGSEVLNAGENILPMPALETQEIPSTIKQPDHDRSPVPDPQKETPPKAESKTESGTHGIFGEDDKKHGDTEAIHPAHGPETVMEEAFEEAFAQAGEDKVDQLFHKGAEIEATFFGDPFLRTLYLLEQGAVLGKEDERFLIKKDGNIIKEIPAIKVDQILVFGNVQLTTQVMKFCLEHNIPIILLSSAGTYFGSVESFKKTNAELHKKQFEISDNPDFALAVGKEIVRAKITNSKVLMQRYKRNRPAVDIGKEIQGMDTALGEIPQALEREVLMGVEGLASANYFAAFRKLIGDEWEFTKREKHPPRDPVNSMLSFGYTLLFYNVYALVRMHGLHPYVGFLHSIRQGHPSLVSDLIEEFRAPVVDAVVLNLIVRGSLRREDFVKPENADDSICLLKDEARKTFLKAFEGKMNTQITHNATGYQVDYRRCMDLQVQAIRRAVEGESAAYQPVTIK